MLATSGQSVPTGPEWQFEVKHDGYRMVARIEPGKARIWSRWGLREPPRGVVTPLPVAHDARDDFANEFEVVAPGSKAGWCVRHDLRNPP